MSFVEWAVDHVADDKKSRRYKRVDDSKHEYELWERDGNVNMSIVITGLPTDFVIIDPNRVGQWSWFKDLADWNDRCDFLIIGKFDEVLFAFLIELKKSMGPLNRQKAQNQLRWSHSLLRYALSIYNILNPQPFTNPT